MATKMFEFKNANKMPIGKNELKLKLRTTRSKEVDHKLAQRMIAEKFVKNKLNVKILIKFLRMSARVSELLKKKSHRTASVPNPNADKDYKSLLLEIMAKKFDLFSIN